MCNGDSLPPGDTRLRVDAAPPLGLIDPRDENDCESSTSPVSKLDETPPHNIGRATVSPAQSHGTMHEERAGTDVSRRTERLTNMLGNRNWLLWSANRGARNWSLSL